MRKEFVDYIGSLLFNGQVKQPLQLKSEKQFRVQQDGSLTTEHSVVTEILVGTDAIYMTYRLPDGNTVSFVNAITAVDYQVKNDYTIDTIVYQTATPKSGNEEKSSFILSCENDHLKLIGVKSMNEQEQICYEITE